MAHNAYLETTISPCIYHAIDFLTRPLIPNENPETITVIKSLLQTTLFLPAEDLMLTLSFSTTSFPPRSVFAACIASGLSWVRWMNLLGGRDFCLVIEPESVAVTYLGRETQTFLLFPRQKSKTIDPITFPHVSADEPQIIPENFGVKFDTQTCLGATIHSAHPRPPSQTLAQHLLESDEENEAAEIFALISELTILSPTPTRSVFSWDRAEGLTSVSGFNLTYSPPPSSPEPTDSTRSSSRSSTSSFSSDSESSTTASSLSFIDFLPASNAPVTLTIPSQLVNESEPNLALSQRGPRVVVDNVKKEAIKYLYQDGVSTVLTGGVMLGCSKPRSRNNEPSFRHQPIFSGSKFSASTHNTAASAMSWRAGPQIQALPLRRRQY